MNLLPPGGPRNVEVSISPVPSGPAAPLKPCPPPAHEMPPVAEDAGLFEYWRLLKRHPGVMLLTTLSGLLAAAIVTLPQTPVYRARALIEILSLNENFLNLREVSPTSTGAMLPEHDIQTNVKILQSQSLLNAVVDRLNADERFAQAKPAGGLTAWRKAFKATAPPPLTARESALAVIAANLKVRAQPNSRLIEVFFSSPDPKLAADFVNALSIEFIEQNVQSRWQAIEHTGEWFKRQMGDLRIRLEKSELAMRNYARTSGLIFTGENENVAEEKLRQIQQELSRSQADLAVRQSRYELAISASPDSLPEVLDDTTLKSYQINLTDLRRQSAELTSMLTPVHPNVKRVAAQVALLEEALAKERANVVKRVQNEYEAAQRREALLTADYVAHTRMMADQSDKVSHYSILKREVDTTRSMYETMLQRVKEAGLAAAVRASNIRVVDAAVPPKHPFRPSLPVAGAVGLAAGLFAGVAFVIGRDRLDRRIHEPGETPLFVSVPELGVIPSAGADPGRQLSRLAYRARRAALLLPGSPAPGDGCFELVAWQRRPSILAESFRTAVTSILLSGTDGERPRVIVVSSANPEEGKTSVASNLAIAIAETNQDVLLIDGDIRKPRLHQVFEVDNSDGLSDLLRAAPRPNESCILARRTKVPNLWIMPSGSTDDPANLVYSKRLPELIRAARSEFAFVLIDTPPVLQIGDARVFARNADAVVLIVRSRHTTRDDVNAACQLFEQDRANVLGTILNDWTPEAAGSHGCYRKYFKYYERYHRKA